MTIDLRASALNVTGYPGNAHTLTLTWPAGTLVGTTWAATIDDVPVTSVTVVGDTLVIVLTIPAVVGGYELVLIQTDVTPDAVKATGRVRSTETAQTDLDSTNLTVTLATASGAVTVVGTGPAGAGGAGGVTDGDKGDITVTASGATWTIDPNAVTNAKLADVPTATIKGRATALTGDPEDLTPAQAKTVLALVKADVGLANVDNTSDANKPVSTATQTALDAKAATTDPRFPAGADIVDADISATAAIAESKLALASDAAAATPSRRSLGTGATQAAAGNDARLSDARTPTAHAASHASAGADPVTLAQSQVTNLTTDLAAKAPLASPTFTGTPAAPTAAAGTNTTHLATTAFAAAGFTPVSGQFDVNTVALSGAAQTLPATVPAHRVTMDANCTFTFTSPTKTGHTFSLLLSGAFTPTFPASVRWNSGTAPTYATASKYVFETVNGGTIWVGTLVASGFTPT